MGSLSLCEGLICRGRPPRGWEDSHDVGAPADLPVEPLGGAVGPDLAAHAVGEGTEHEQIIGGIVEVVGELRQATVSVLQESVELLMHRVGVGWSYTLCSAAFTADHMESVHTAMRFAA